MPIPIASGLTPKLMAMAGNAVRMTVLSNISMNNAPADTETMNAVDGLCIGPL